MLLKYKGLYKFLLEHAPDVASEIKEAYTTTMSAIYLRHVKGYLADLMRVRVDSATKGVGGCNVCNGCNDQRGGRRDGAEPEPVGVPRRRFNSVRWRARGGVRAWWFARGGGVRAARVVACTWRVARLGPRLMACAWWRRQDLLGNEEWGVSPFNPAALFGNKPATARGDGAYKLGERSAVLSAVQEAPLIPAVLQQAGTTLHYEAIFRSVSTLLMDTVGCEYDFVVEFFGSDEVFENIFGKAM